jgi:hypothetical protein
MSPIEWIALGIASFAVGGASVICWYCMTTAHYGPPFPLCEEEEEDVRDRAGPRHSSTVT